jgi:plasmid stability protein
LTSITIRNLDEKSTRNLAERAADHGQTVEAEARDILQAALGGRAPTVDAVNLYQAIRNIVEPIGGGDISMPPRQPVREPPRFD